MEGGMTRRHHSSDCSFKLCSPDDECEQIEIRVPAMEDDIPLFRAISYGTISAVESVLQAGANVDGHPDQPYAPIGLAIVGIRTDIVNHLLRHGADPDKLVTVYVLLPGRVVGRPILGARALHIAIMMANVEIIRLLLKCSRADLNATDNEGTTPLLTACSRQRISVETVRLLLEAGADPALANDKGTIPLHVAAHSDMPELIDMLHSSAPVTINRCKANGMTTLYIACNLGEERVVSKLLSLGATQPKLSLESNVCPLWTAVEKGFVGIVRVLLNDRGIKAVGGKTVLHTALAFAIVCRRAIILRLLLTADGVKGRSELANSYHDRTYLLHYGAGYCYLAAVSTLLEAGADETARESTGRIARDVIGFGIRADVQIDRGDAVAIRRMLQRGPAYRARSWAWPSHEDAGASGVGDATAGDTGVGVGAAATAAAAAARSSPQVVKLPRLTVFRRKDIKSSKLLVRPLARY